MKNVSDLFTDRVGDKTNLFKHHSLNRLRGARLRSGFMVLSLIAAGSAGWIWGLSTCPFS